MEVETEAENIEANETPKKKRNNKNNPKESEPEKSKKTAKISSSDNNEIDKNAELDEEDPNDSNWADVSTNENNEKVNKVTKKKNQPKKSLLKQLRAISTPNRNESHLQSDITFMNQSDADISAIPVLSPPTVKKAKKKPLVKEASFQ